MIFSEIINLLSEYQLIIITLFQRSLTFYVTRNTVELDDGIKMLKFYTYEWIVICCFIICLAYVNETMSKPYKHQSDIYQIFIRHQDGNTGGINKTGHNRAGTVKA